MTHRHAVGLQELPPIEVAERPYAEAVRAVLVGLGGSDTAAMRSELRARGWQVREVRLDVSGRFDEDTAELEDRLSTVFAEPTELCVLVLDGVATWDGQVRALAESIVVAKHACPVLDHAAARGSRAGFLALTRVDGGLGRRGDTASAGLLSGIGGLVKTLAAESPEVFCRVVDVAPELDAGTATGIALDEADDVARDTIEVAIDGELRRWTLVPSGYALDAHPSAPVREVSEALTVGGDDVLVVTGGGRGVTALCVRALAQRAAAEFLLLGRTELVEEPPWARGVDDGELKAAAIAALRAEGATPTPREVDRLCRAELAQREIRATVEAVTAAGARARYLAVDVTDTDAVRVALDEYRDVITGVVHGAGVLADAHLTEKTGSQIHRVFEAKLGGLRAVLDVVDQTSLRHLVLFTSVAGLFGNAGQADYAVANEALCGFAASWKRRHPQCHATAIDWGAWDGGMVTPELRQLFQDRGVSLLAPEVGARAFVEQFGISHQDETCVLVGADTSLSTPGTASGSGFGATRYLATLGEHEVIQAHRIGEHPVLPATFGLGWLINLAERAHPGLRVREVRDFQVHKGILFDGTTPDGYRGELVPAGTDGDDLLLTVSVRGVGGPRPISHYSATLRLSTRPTSVDRIDPGVGTGAGGQDGADLYRQAIQFHGPRLQGMRRVLERRDDRVVIECRLSDERVAAGAFAGALHSPVLTDLLLQGPPVLGKWRRGQACLPLSIGQAEYVAPLPDDEPFLLVLDGVVESAAGMTVTATACDADGAVLVRFHDVAVVATPDMDAKFAESVRRWRSAELAEPGAGALAAVEGQ